MNVLEHVWWGWVGGGLHAVTCSPLPGVPHCWHIECYPLISLGVSISIERFLFFLFFFAKRIMCRQAKGRGPRKQLMTSVPTYVARLPYSRSNCAEVTGNNEMSSAGVWKHKEAHRPDIDAGCILGGKMAFYDYFKISLAQTYCDPPWVRFWIN